MNIAPSPDPSPMPPPCDRVAAGALPEQDCRKSPFSDLLDTPPEHLRDVKTAPCKPRKHSPDGTEPELAMMLPCMLQQAIPAGSPGPEGTAVQLPDGNSAGATQAAEVGAVTDSSAGAGTPEKSNFINSITVQSNGEQLMAFAPAATVSGADGADKSTASSTDSKNTSAPVLSAATQPVQAGGEAVGLAAENSPLLKTEISNPVLPAAIFESEKVALQRAFASAPPTVVGEQGGGTVAAMEQVIMKDQSPERQMRTAGSVAVAPFAAGKLRGAGMSEKSSEVRMSDSGTSTQTLAGMNFEPQAGRGQADNVTAGLEVPVAAEITRQTFEIIERVRTTGRESAEVRMHLNDGQEVTVSLRLERGEWKPVFKTESEALCRALEQNWHRTLPQSSSQSAKFGTPVFESQSSLSGAGRDSQQQSESGGRERSFNRRDQESVFENPVPFRVNAKPVRAAQPTRFSEAAAMQVYA